MLKSCGQKSFNNTENPYFRNVLYVEFESAEKYTCLLHFQWITLRGNCT